MTLDTSGPLRSLITHGDLTEDNFPANKTEFMRTIDRAVDRGIEFVQIREKRLDARFVFELAREAGRIASGSGTKILVNERFDVAMAAGVHGVHLTSRSIPIATVRKFAGMGFIIGTSAHSSDDVLYAKLSGADFALLGNIFATPGKGEPLGVEKLREACVAADGFPVIAVGGIDAENSEAVTEAGAAGYAAIRYLNDFVNIGE